MSLCDQSHTKYDCDACAIAKERHEAILNVLVEINQNLSTLLTERRQDSSVAAVVDKLEDIQRSLRNR
jgi:hypothetical protein